MKTWITFCTFHVSCHCIYKYAATELKSFIWYSIHFVQSCYYFREKTSPENTTLAFWFNAKFIWSFENVSITVNGYLFESSPSSFICIHFNDDSGWLHSKHEVWIYTKQIEFSNNEFDACVCAMCNVQCILLFIWMYTQKCSSAVNCR